MVRSAVVLQEDAHVDIVEQDATASLLGRAGGRLHSKTLLVVEIVCNYLDPTFALFFLYPWDLFGITLALGGQN